jgi:hypothetical protein
MLINHAEKTNKCTAARKFRALEANIKSCRLQNEKLINVNATQKFFNVPKHDHFQELEQETFKFVHLEANTGALITHSQCAH